MIRFATSESLTDEPNFSEDGTHPEETYRDRPGRVWATAEGVSDSLRFYGREDMRGNRNPLIYLGGDVFSAGVQHGGNLKFGKRYLSQSPYTKQREAERLSVAMGRTFVDLARPGTHGSTGDHGQRRRPREVALVADALDQLRQAFGWSRVDLVGQSGGGTLVALLMARRDYIDCAVIASGIVALWERIRERREQGKQDHNNDVTGFSELSDPIDEVAGVVRHLPRKLIMLTDPRDRRVSATSQRFYARALLDAGFPEDRLDYREISADDDEWHHNLKLPALLAASSAMSG